MFLSKRSTLSPTLLCYLTIVLALVSASEASAPVARDHVQLNRMIKKRGFLPLQDVPIARALTPTVPGPVAEPGAEPPSFSGSATPSGSSVAPSVTPSASADPTPSGSSAPVSSPGSASVSASDSASVSASSDVPSSASSAPPSSVSSTPPSSASAPSATPSAADQAPASSDTPPPSSKASYTSKAVSRVTATVTDDTGASQTAAPVGAASTSSKVTKTTVIVIAAVAASIGGVFVLWTIIRKWKFKPSADFEDRMQPIDWQPTTADDGVPGLHRSGTAISHGSFHSGSGHTDDFSSRGFGSDQNSLQPIPDHDFTAGAATLAPVGGYADLARGPSPGPQMSQLARGPSTHHPEYESYGVPLHHQNAYDYNSSAGAQY